MGTTRMLQRATTKPSKRKHTRNVDHRAPNAKDTAGFGNEHSKNPQRTQRQASAMRASRNRSQSKGSAK